jgi:glutathione S-transferase
MLATVVVFPENYGYVFAVLSASFFMNYYLSYNVISARKKYGVEYPALYAPSCHKFEIQFNSVQRAHQNTLEIYAATMLQMCLNGMVYPVTSAIFGGIWVLGRIIFGAGYSRYGPAGRGVGSLVTALGSVPLLIISMKISYDLLSK